LVCLARTVCEGGLWACCLYVAATAVPTTHEWGVIGARVELWGCCSYAGR